MANHSSKTFWLVSSNRWNSAVTEYALSAAKALQRSGQNVVFSPLTDSPAESRAKSEGIEAKPLVNFSMSGVFAFRTVYRQIRPEVVIFFGGPETFLGKFIGAKKIRFWGEAGRSVERFARFSGRLAASHLDAFWVPSEKMRVELASRTTIPVRFIRLGTDEKVFRRIETMGGFLQKRPQVLIVGRLDPVKGHEQALTFLKDAFARWRDHHRRPCLHIVGQPANISEALLKTWVDRLGLKINEDVVITTSRIPNIAELMSQSILGLIPSQDSEVICRVAQEFLMCGTPIVVSGVGSLEEALFNDNAGSSYRALADGAERATLVMNWVDKSLSEGELAKRKRAQLAVERFSLRSMAKAILDSLVD